MDLLHLPLWCRYVIIILTALCATEWIHLYILRIAKAKNIVDNPDARKLQKQPIPVLGGLAVNFGLLIGLFLTPLMFHDTEMLLPVILSTSVMLYIGSIDDLTELTPLMRAIIEALTILGLIFASGKCIDSFHGLWGIHEFSWYLAVPLTVFAGVGIINAYNMIDGVNGLSSGLCIETSLVLGVFFAKSSMHAEAGLALAFAGALVPFLFHNVFGKHSRMFIGDGGTMVMGLIVTWFVIIALSKDGLATTQPLKIPGLTLNYVAAMLAMASVPVCDTLRVMIGRLLAHHSPFEPDRTHLHHQFIDMGISHSFTALSEVLLNLTVMAIWYASYKAGASPSMQFNIVFGAAAILVLGTYYFLHYHATHQTGLCNWIQQHSHVTHVGHTSWWLALQQFLDRNAQDTTQTPSQN